MTATDRTQVVLGILNLLMGALCLLAFAFGESPALLIGLLCLPVAYLLLKDFDFEG
jgi:sulfite exporter TauE/SafE